MMTSPLVESEAMSLLSSAAFQLAALASELTSDRNLLTEFLSLQVSTRTRQTYRRCAAVVSRTALNSEPSSHCGQCVEFARCWPRL